MTPELKGLIEALFSDTGATQKSVLDTRQVIVLARAKTFAKMYKIPELDALCETLMQLKISEKGRGRKDLIQALQARRQNDDERMSEIRQRNRLIGN